MVRTPAGDAAIRRALRLLATDLDAGLAELRFDEITDDDRITYISAVLEAHVRWTRSRGLGRAVPALRALAHQRLQRRGILMRT